jgi:Flp pilus assembly protein TadG
MDRPVFPLHRFVAARCNHARSERGGGVLIELALVLPVLITLVLGTIDFGRFAYFHIAVTNSARAGAGYGMMHPYTSTTQATWQGNIRDAVKNEMQGVPNYNDNSLLMSTPQVTTDSDGQKRVRVQVQYPFSTLIAWPFVPSNFLLQRAVEMRFIR